MKTFYEVNGRWFEDIEEANKYEVKVQAEKEKKEKLVKEKDNRKKEVDEAYRHYIDLKTQFDKDYKPTVSVFDYHSAKDIHDQIREMESMLFGNGSRQ
jgi:hypothetical protein